jgi:hypothetical protein
MLRVKQSLLDNLQFASRRGIYFSFKNNSHNLSTKYFFKIDTATINFLIFLYVFQSIKFGLKSE